MEFLSRADAVTFVGKSRADPYTYRLPVTDEPIKLPAGWPTTLEQQTRGRLLNPLYAAVGDGPFAGHLRVGYQEAHDRRHSFRLPYRTAPSSVGYAVDPDNERVVRIEAGPELIKRPEVLKPIETAAGMPLDEGVLATSVVDGGGRLARGPERLAFGHLLRMHWWLACLCCYMEHSRTLY